MNFLPVSK